MAGCVLWRSILSAVQVVQVVEALSGSGGLALIVWLLLKTRTARAADWSGSVKIVKRRLRAEGVPEDQCQKLIADSARKHLDLPDAPQ
jgi:hypothetical protein